MTMEFTEDYPSKVGWLVGVGVGVIVPRPDSSASLTAFHVSI